MRRFRDIDAKMSHPLGRRILCFWATLLMVSGLFRLALAAVPGMHGGKVIIEQGRQYEVVSNPGLHQIKVYAKPVLGPPDNTLTVYLRSRGKPRNPVKLVLSEVTRDSWVYSGLIPARILIGAGVRVDVDLK
jgi:hypothetical protein